MLLKRKMLFYLLLSFSYLLVSISTTLAQKKKLTYDQVYQRAKPRLTKSLPRIQGWLDDNFYLESKKVSEKKDAKTKLFKINAKTGEEIIYIDYDAFEDKLPKGFSLRSSSVHTDDYTGFVFNQKNDLFYLSPTLLFQRSSRQIPYLKLNLHIKTYLFIPFFICRSNRKPKKCR